MRLRNMLRICLVFWKTEPRYAYKGYAYKIKTCTENIKFEFCNARNVMGRSYLLVSSF